MLEILNNLILVVFVLGFVLLVAVVVAALEAIPPYYEQDARVEEIPS